MCLPMKARGRTIGALTFVSTASGRRLGPADLAMAEEVAARAGSAVDNARLYQEHTYISKTLQKSLLPPHLPEIPGVDVAARYHAAGEGYEVGGDFYDLFEVARGDWAILVGDVCGKGADAAATTALAPHTFRAAAMQARKPSRVLRTLNEAILRAETRFCTTAYVRLRPNSTGAARATIACGGHPLPLLLRADGRLEVAGKPGTLLGSFPEPELTDQTVDLRSGDVLVLYTDGVTEARSDHQTFGEDRLRAVLEARRGKSAAEIAAAIEEAALEFQQGRARDDIAVVVLRMR
jgi:serine phosphatase RsbU (regulator of sigma subunit)